MTDFEKMSLVELREIAKNKDVKNISKFKKEELIEVLKTYNYDDKEMPKIVANTVNEKTNNTQLQEENSAYKLTNEEDQIIEGILEVLPDGYGFLRGENFLSTPKDVYISPIQIRRFRLETGDMIKGIARLSKEGEKFPSLIYVGEVNGEAPDKALRRTRFDDLTPIFPTERLKLETVSKELSMRIIDLMSPIR